MHLPNGLDVDGPHPQHFDLFSDDADSSIHGRDGGISSSDECWKRARCHCTCFDWIVDGWQCAQCSSRDFYDSNRATRRDTEDGVWFYMPRQAGLGQAVPMMQAQDPRQPDTSPNGFSPDTGSRSDVGSRHSGYNVGVHHSPPGSSISDSNREFAESEDPTDDPIINPDVPPRRRRRRQRAQFRQDAQDNPPFMQPARPQAQLPPADQARNLQQSVDQLVRTLQGAMGTNRRATGSSESWNSRMGPERGVKFRSGAPPTPPAWKYHKEDLRSFVKWQKKLQVWKLQVSSYMSSRDAALFLFTSLTGEAEEELEHCSIDRINSSDGVQYIEEQLKQGLQTKMVYQKRKLMSDYESIVRQQGESLRAFCNRYRRAERALESVNVNVGGMYDSESKGSRLLDRSRLSPENQRLVLIGTAYNLEFNAIQESLCMSFPEHKPPPPLFGKDGQPIKTFRRENSQASGSSSSSSTSTASSAASKGKGKGKNFGKVRQAFVAEHEEGEHLDPINEENEDCPGGPVEGWRARRW